MFGGHWHTDLSFLERLPGGSVLAVAIVPPFGGDTLRASGAAAWDALPEPLQAPLLGRDAIHAGKPYGVRCALLASERIVMSKVDVWEASPCPSPSRPSISPRDPITVAAPEIARGESPPFPRLNPAT